MCLLLPARDMQGAFPASVQDFLRQHCFECHDTATSKGRLSLEALPQTPEIPASLERWVRVLDRVADREMPPAGKPQPTAEERTAFVRGLGTELAQASRAGQQSRGRASIRRLNRVEYENALSDLLGVRVDVQPLLPEDTPSAGFDTVGEGLGTSSQHLLRYQEAAARAMEAASPAQAPTFLRRRLTGREWFRAERASAGRDAATLLETGARVVGDAVEFHAQSDVHPHLDWEAGKPVSPGRYRVRVSASARQSRGQPLAMLFLLTGGNAAQDHTLSRVLSVRDVRPGAAAVIEEEFEVPHGSARWEGHGIGIRGWSLPWQPQPAALEAERLLGEKPKFDGPALAIDWVEIEGPLPPSQPSGLQRLVSGSPSDAARRIRDVLPLAFRGPVEEEVGARVVRFAEAELAKGRGVTEVMRLVGQDILCSPRFLLRIERPGPLDGPALATRLALFLWASVPDEALLARARQGSLATREGLHETVEWMLRDPRSRRFIDQFTGQWLELRRLYATRPDAMYPEFDDPLLWSMPLETTGFFRELLEKDGSVLEFVRSDWTWLNGRLARHYGVPGISGWEFRRAALPAGSHRGGVLTQASVLKVTANGTTTSPVLRGKWILEAILGTPPQPPPPDVPKLEPDIRGAITIRQQLEKHRAQPACAGCHRRIDPPGFALETFDVIGGWRDWYRSHDEFARRSPVPNYPGLRVQRGPDVEKGYTLEGGRAFADIDEYRAILLENPDALVANVVRKLVVYGTGADIQFADREVIDGIVAEARARGSGLRSLIHAVVASRMFRER